MMVKYINKSKGIGTVKFSDGKAQFLFAGQFFESDKKVVSKSAGIVEITKPKQSPKKSKKSSEKAVQESSDQKDKVIENGETK